jgi:tRNA wybutosine-synthesizing protein 2
MPDRITNSPQPEADGPNNSGPLCIDKPLRRKSKHKPRREVSNPLQSGLLAFLSLHCANATHSNYSGYAESRPADIDPTLSLPLPKRYTLYPPLLLLPANVFSATPVWTAFYAELSSAEKQELYACIVQAFRGQGQGVTHVAINAPIAAETETAVVGQGIAFSANVMRSPTGLVPLYGDWGPRGLVADVLAGGDEGLGEAGQPRKEDFETAFWVSAVQNGGVVQVWAPLWTMFSRGNVKEKARILGEGDGVFEGLDGGGGKGILGQALGDISIVDMFVGIGYFAFSYLKRGVGLVWGWEINGWSVEGLRRGCKRNGWRVEILRVHRDGQVVDEDGREGDEALKGLTKRIDVVQDEAEDKGRIRCVVFHGDNKWSEKIMTLLSEMSLHGQLNGKWKRVRHVNLGLLPHARDSWQNSVRVLDSDVGGWLHVHENVDIRDFQSRKAEIVQDIGKLVAADVAKRGQWETSCSHLEEVKTYAPGVMHCVFDIQILPQDSKTY